MQIRSIIAIYLAWLVIRNYCSLDETNVKTAEWELRKHRGKASDAYIEGSDIKLAPDSLIIYVDFETSLFQLFLIILL